MTETEKLQRIQDDLDAIAESVAQLTERELEELEALLDVSPADGE